MHSLLQRNRNQEGYSIVDEDTSTSEDIKISDDLLNNKPYIIKLVSSILYEADKVFNHSNFLAIREYQSNAKYE
jgi:hypothetical protein